MNHSAFSADPAPASATSRVTWRRAALLLLLALLYLPSLSHGFVLDDFVFIADNPAVSRGARLGAYFTDRDTTASDEKLRIQVYRPLRALSLRAVAATFGMRPSAYHAVNLALYGLATLLVLAVLTGVTGHPRASFVATALWVAAPVHVESVVYAAALGDQLSLVLELLAVLAGLRCLSFGGTQHGASEMDPGASGGSTASAGSAASAAWFAASLVLAAGSMLAKEMAVTEAGLLALLIVARLGWGALRRPAALLLLLAHAIVTLGFLALRTAVLGQVGQMPITAAAFVRGLGESGVLLAHYLRICLMPLEHCAAYVMPVPSSLSMAAGLVGALAVGMLALRLSLGGFIRRPLPSQATGGRTALWLGVFWFIVALLPVLHLVPVLADLADRFALLPSVGLALLCAGGLLALPARARRIGDVLAVVVLLLWGAGTLIEARFWSSDNLLWRHAADVEPESAQAHNNLGVVLLQEGNSEAALKEFNRSAELGRDNAELDLRRAMALESLGRPTPALAAVNIALQKDGRLGRGHALRGELLRQMNRLAEAQTELALAQALAPEHPSVGLLAAALALALGRPAEALAGYAGLAARFPTESRFSYLLARAALQAGDAPQAVNAARRCIALSPQSPHCAGVLGRALLLSGESPHEARVALDRALHDLPDGPEKQDCQAARQSLK